MIFVSLQKMIRQDTFIVLLSSASECQHPALAVRKTVNNSFAWNRVISPAKLKHIIEQRKEPKEISMVKVSEPGGAEH